MYNILLCYVQLRPSLILLYCSIMPFCLIYYVMVHCAIMSAFITSCSIVELELILLSYV